MRTAFIAKEGSRFVPGPMLALMEEDGVLYVATPRRITKLTIYSLQGAVILLPLFAIFGAAFLFAKALKGDAILAVFLVFFAWILVLAAFQGRILSRASDYLARDPVAKFPFVVQAVRPTLHVRCHEVRGVAGNRGLVLAVWGDWNSLTQALTSGGFTATKQRKLS